VVSLKKACKSPQITLIANQIRFQCLNIKESFSLITNQNLYMLITTINYSTSIKKQFNLFKLFTSHKSISFWLLHVQFHSHFSNIYFLLLLRKQGNENIFTTMSFLVYIKVLAWSLPSSSSWLLTQNVNNNSRKTFLYIKK